MFVHGSRCCLVLVAKLEHIQRAHEVLAGIFGSTLGAGVLLGDKGYPTGSEKLSPKGASQPASPQKQIRVLTTCEHVSVKHESHRFRGHEEISEGGPDMADVAAMAL